MSDAFDCRVNNFRTTGAGWVERTRCFTDTGEELAPNLNFPANNWRGNPHRCIAAASYPLVFVPAAPDAIPSELLALQDDTPIVTRRETAPYDAIAKAGVIRAEVADAIERHKHGLYTAREIAHLSYKSASASSRTYSGDSESEYQEMASAFKSGRLIAFKRTGKLLRDSEIRQFPGVLSQSSAALNAMNDCWFKLDDVNAWLESERATWRLQSPSAPSASAPAVALPEPVAPVPPMPSTSAPAVAGPESAGALPLTNWKMRVQEAAAARWLDLRGRGMNPTVVSILGDMVRWCRENDVLTSSGITPSEGYLRTHVLGGENWTPPTKQRRTS